MTCKHYESAVGIILEVDTTEDLTTATDTKIYLLKPDGTELVLPATVYNSTYLRYTTVEGDLDQIGFYRVQAGFTKGNWTGRGSTAEFAIYPKFA